MRGSCARVAAESAGMLPPVATQHSMHCLRCLWDTTCMCRSACLPVVSIARLRQQGRTSLLRGIGFKPESCRLDLGSHCLRPAQLLGCDLMEERHDICFSKEQGDACRLCGHTFLVISLTPVSGQVLPPSSNHLRMLCRSYVIPVSTCR